MITGILLASLAGLLVSVQTVFNSKVNEHNSSWSTTTLVLGMGFLASFVLGLIVEGGDMFHLGGMKLWYIFSGLIGVGVVFCLVHAMKNLDPTFAISIVVTAQLGTALLWDSLGLLGLEKIPFSWNKLVGVLVIVVGIVIFKLGDFKRGTNQDQLESSQGNA